jgi:hypothetical protein
MTSKMNKINSHNPKKLLVEGNDDLHVIGSIWKRTKGDEIPPFFIKDCKGKDNIPPDLRAIFQNPISTKILGIVIDADFTLTEYWQSVRDLLGSIGYSIPEKPAAEGVIANSNGKYPRLGIWLMPDNATSGMLEDFVKYLVPTNDKLWPESERILSEIESQSLQRYSKDLHRSKALIHTWLAWQEDPGTPMGLAITKSYLTTNQELCQRFVNWLERLFDSKEE